MFDVKTPDSDCHVRQLFAGCFPGSCISDNSLFCHLITGYCADLLSSLILAFPDTRSWFFACLFVCFDQLCLFSRIQCLGLKQTLKFSNQWANQRCWDQWHCDNLVPGQRAGQPGTELAMKIKEQDTGPNSTWNCKNESAPFILLSVLIKLQLIIKTICCVFSWMGKQNPLKREGWLFLLKMGTHLLLLKPFYPSFANFHLVTVSSDPLLTLQSKM